jgi:beta-galactosidase GanA
MFRTTLQQRGYGYHCQKQIFNQQGATAVLALELGGREPHFTLVLGGEPLLTAASHTAPFHVLLLFLHAANTAHGALFACDATVVAPVRLPSQSKWWSSYTGMAGWQFCRHMGAASLTRSCYLPWHREH